MYIEKISASSYNTETDCQGKYYIDKILKHRFPGKWIATPKGTITHHVLEVLALIKLAQQNGLTTINDEIFGQDWEFPVEITPEVLDKLITDSYNNIKQSESHHQWKDDDLLEVKAWVNKTLEYCNGEYNPLNSKIIAVEQHFELPIREDWAKITDDKYLCINGYIDLIKETENGIEIVDYKTGKRKNYETGRNKDYEDFLDDIQLLIYRYAASILYPHIDHFLITIYYINHGGTFTMVFDACDINKLILKIKQKYQRIKNAE